MDIHVIDSFIVPGLSYSFSLGDRPISSFQRHYLNKIIYQLAATTLVTASTLKRISKYTTSRLRVQNIREKEFKNLWNKPKKKSGCYDITNTEGRSVEKKAGDRFILYLNADNVSVTENKQPLKLLFPGHKHFNILNARNLSTGPCT